MNSVFSQKKKKKKKTEDRRIFNFSITFSRILIEPPFSISSQNFAGHRRIRFFHGKRIEMDWFRWYVPGFRLRSSTISKLEYIIVSRSKSNRVERNVIFLRQCENKSRVKLLFPTFGSLSSSRRNCYPNRDHRSSGYIVKNWWKIRSMIGKYDPILPSNPFGYLKIARKMKNLSRFLLALPPVFQKKYGNPSKLTIYSRVRVNKLEPPNRVKLINLVFFFCNNN